MGVVASYKRYKRRRWLQLGRYLLVALLALCPIGLIAYACRQRSVPQFTIRKLLLLDERRYNRIGLPNRVGQDSVDIQLSFRSYSLQLDRAVIRGTDGSLSSLFDQAREFSAYDPIMVDAGRCLLLPEGFFFWSGDSLLYTAFANSDNQIK